MPPRPSSCTPCARACPASWATNTGSRASAIASAVTSCSAVGPACAGTAESSTTAPAVLLSVVTVCITMSSLLELHRFHDTPRGGVDVGCQSAVAADDGVVAVTGGPQVPHLVGAAVGRPLLQLQALRAAAAVDV